MEVDRSAKPSRGLFLGMETGQMESRRPRLNWTELTKPFHKNASSTLHSFPASPFFRAWNTRPLTSLSHRPALSSARNLLAPPSPRLALPTHRRPLFVCFALSCDVSFAESAVNLRRPLFSMTIISAPLCSWFLKHKTMKAHIRKICAYILVYK